MDNFSRANYTEKDLESIMKRVYNGNPRFAKRASYGVNQAYNILNHFGKPTVRAWANGDPSGSAVASELADIDFDGSVAKALREAIGYQAKARFNTNRKNAMNHTHRRANRKSTKIAFYFSAFNRSGDVVDITAEPHRDGYIWSYQGPNVEDQAQLEMSLPLPEAYDLFLSTFGLTKGDFWGPEVYTYSSHRANRKNTMNHTSRRANHKRASEPNSQQIKDFSNTAREFDSVDVLESYNGEYLINFNLSSVKNALTVRVSDSELQTVYDALDQASDFSIDGKSFRYTGDGWQIWSHSGSGGFTIQDTALARIKPELMNLMNDNRTSRRANHKRAYFGGEMDWENIADEGDPIYGSSGEGLDGFYYSFYVYADEVNLVFEAQNEDTMDPKEVWTYEHGGDIPSGEYLAALGDAMAVDFVRTGGVSNPIGNVFRRANRKRANLMSLDEALQQVANASFYEDLVVIPVDGGFVVEDGYSYLAEGWEYTEMGLDGPDHFETTRLMESYESFDTAQHIRYNMPESVEALENGQAVEFAYAVVMDLDIDWGDDELNEMYEGDEVAGWLLVSQIQ